MSQQLITKRMEKKNVEEVYALTPLQEGLLFHYLKDPASNRYIEQFCLDISGEINREWFEQAWNFVTDTNEVLRTVFRWEQLGSPVQVVLRKKNPQINFYDYSLTNDIDREKLTNQLISKGKNKKFNLREVPFRITLCKSRKDYCKLILSYHHILFDGWSTGIILSEFFKNYDDLSSGQKLQKLVKNRFKDYVKWLKIKSRDQYKYNQEKFWKEYLREFDTPAVLTIKKKQSKGKIEYGDGGRVGRYVIRFTREMKNQLNSSLKSRKITLAALLYTAWGILIQKYTNSKDVVFGTTVSGRSAKIKGIENIVGLFINTLPLRVKTYPGEKIQTLLHRINKNLEIKEKYESNSLVEIKEYSELDNQEELFNSLVVIENYPLRKNLITGNNKLSIRSYSVFEMTHYDITVIISTVSGIEISIIYNEYLFEEDTIVRLSGHFKRIIEQVAGYPGKETSKIKILSKEEKRILLEEFNNAEVVNPAFKTIYQLFARQAGRTPDNIALIGQIPNPKSQIPNKRAKSQELRAVTYGELNEKSNQLAHLLREKGVEPDIIVGIMMERSIEMIIGILGILKAGGAYLPIDPEFPKERIDYMLKDSGSKILLTSHEIVILSSPEAFNNRPKGTSSFGIWNLEFGISPQQGGQLAYVIYTSGSTGKPKGVMVEHGAVVNILWALQKKYPLTASGTYLLKTSYIFDVSVTELFGWFLEGGRLAILEKEGQKDPQKIIDAVEKAGVTHINFVPSMFNVFVDALNSQNINQLSGLRYIFLAGEALLPGPVDRFRCLNTTIALENIYGPTEGTIYSSKYSLSHWQGEGSIPIGKPLPNIRLYILDKDNQLQPIGLPGELSIGGVGLARGYLNNPELTAEKFIELEIKVEVEEGEAPCGQPMQSCNHETIHPYIHTSMQYHSFHYPIYRACDLARWLPDGNIEFLGRMDHQVKIRGFRVELGEIENRLLNHKYIKEAVVTIRQDKEGESYLIGYIVSSEPAAGDRELQTELREHLTRTLPGYMIPSFFLPIEKMPLTPTGKIDRNALPGPGLKARKEYFEPRNEIEKKLVKIWSRLLHRDHDIIGIDDHFFEIGGHSLKATRLISKIYKEFDIRVGLAAFFKTPTIRWLSAYIELSAEKERFISIEAAEEKEYYPLTPIQKRFFFFQQLEPANISYNMNEAMAVQGRVDKEKFAETFKKIIRRQESLRTSFIVIKGEAVQEVHDVSDIDFTVNYYENSKLQNTKGHDGLDASACHQVYAMSIMESFVRPFDLSKAPLLRVGLIKTMTGDTPFHFFMVDMHHIISDGTSTAIFIGDFLSFYNEEELPTLKVRYRDYVQWLIDRTGVRYGRRSDKEFGLGDFDEELLELPTDYPRPAVQSFEGAKIDFQIGKEETAALNMLSLKEDSTLFMVLFAVFNIFLAKLSGQENIIVGTPIAGRLHDDLEGIMGLFINTIVIRNYPASEKTSSQLLEEVKGNSLQAFENQEYQYEVLAAQIGTARNSNRNPLFDVMFVLQNMEMPELEIPGLKIKRNLQQHRVSKFDMTLYCEEKRDILDFKWEYCTKLFKQEIIESFIKYFKNILSAVLAAPGKKIGEIEFISTGEKREIIFDFNNTTVEYSRDKTIYRLFEEQVERMPENPALIASGGSVLTYRELNQGANRLARVLRARGVKANRVVGIMLERSIDLIVGLYAVLKAGGTYLPIDPGYPVKRILSMLESSQSITLLTKKEIAAKKDLGEVPQEIITIDELASLISNQSGENLQPLSGPGDLIYVIFTSGSTGIPKGAGVFQRSFVNLLNWFVKDFGLNTADINLLMTSFSFDLTQKNFYASLISGGILCIPSTNYFDPGEILREIEENRVTWINCTPSMFFQLIEFCQEDELKKMESLRYVYLGGEPISMSMYMKWVESGYCHGEIVNTYGPTECTDICNSYRVKDPYRFLKETVPVGKPVYNVRLYVVDKNLQLLPVGIPGELLIGGEGVGIGYVNDKELTGKKFVWHSFVSGDPGLLLYRTGDLCKWLADGNIEFIGRIDYQVKIRGFRIEIGEIEKRLLEYEKIKEAVVTDRDDDLGGKYLCAYFVPAGSQPPSSTQLREYLSQALPDYMIPSYFVQLKEMPMNPNGKINRKVLPVPEIVSGREYAAPRSELEESLVNTWAEILGIDNGRIGIDDNFFELGGHSLKAAELTARVHQKLNVEIALREIFKIRTIRNLSEYISREEKSKYMSIELAEEKEYYFLSSAQGRLYLLQQMDLEGTSYNIPAVMLLEGDLQKEILQGTFGKLIKRHDSLRTSFEMIDDEPVQRIHDEVKFEIEYFDLNRTQVKVKVEEGEGTRGLAPLPVEPATPVRSPQTVTSTIKNFIRSFDLSQSSLLRVGLINGGEKQDILMVDMHHIISDGISMGVFVKEFMSLYKREVLPPLRIQYKDFSAWQNKRKESEAIKAQEDYWLNEFTREIPALSLPTDFDRPLIQDFTGDTLDFSLEGKVTKKLKALAVKENSTLYMVLLALFNVLLAKLSGQEEIVVGAPVAGRVHPDLEQVMGMFINTLALRNYPAGEKTIQEFLKEVRDKTLKAQENQEYQFEDLVENVSLERDASRNPLFDVMFVLQNMDISEVEIPGLKLIPYEYENNISKFDLTLQAVEEAENLLFTFEYCTKLFKRETIERFINYFKKTVLLVIDDVEKKILEIEIISEQEKKQLLFDFNDTETEYPTDKVIHQLFEEQVERTPDHTALVGQIPKKEDISITYKELNGKSNQLAHCLREQGIKPDTIAAVLMERSVEMIIGILGIVKAGGAYLPIDPEYPGKRIQYMLEDSAAKTVVVGGKCGDKLKPKEVIDLVYVHDEIHQISCSGNNYSKPGKVIHREDLFYVIYTSGSTGKPKGVPVKHGGFVNMVCFHQEVFGEGPWERMSQVAGPGFDAMAFELWPCLLSGGSLYIADDETRMDPGKMKNWLIEYNITISFQPTVMAELLMMEPWPQGGAALRVLQAAGEQLTRYPPSHLPFHFYNLYGPTEDTVWTTCTEVEPAASQRYEKYPSIGKPIANHQVYILDAGQKPQLLGVRGELYIAGEGLALGYLNRPELTAEKFERVVISHSSLVISSSEKLSKAANDQCPMTNNRLYRTGDLARWLRDGNIEFLGRDDDQVKIRGFRIELGEIERHVSNHPYVKETLVLVKEVDAKNKYLCAYIVSDSELPESELRKFLSASLPGYMIPSYFVMLETMPLTPNGKIDRRALPKPALGIRTKEYAAPRNQVEEKLMEIWSEVLTIEKERIGIDGNFFQLGGHSLKAAIAASKIFKKLYVKLSLIEVFKTPTIRELSERIKELKQKKYVSVKPAEKKEFYELSSAQKRLYILQRVDLKSTNYNMTGIYIFEGKLNREKIARAIQSLIDRHETLRTSIDLVNGEVVQKIADYLGFKLSYQEISTEKDVGKRIKEFVKPFDLIKAPLLRVEIHCLQKEKHVVFFDMHHIVSDGSSMEILVRDFVHLYKGKGLIPLAVQYKDYAAWLNKRLNEDTLRDQENYWLKKLEGFVFTQLPPNHFDSYRQVKGKVEQRKIEKSLYHQIEKFCIQQEVTKFTFMISVFSLVLAREIDQADITIGIPVSIRENFDLNNLIGIFLNVLLIRSIIDEEDNFLNHLAKSKETVIEALNHQDYPYEMLAYKIRDNSHLNKTELFSILFNYSPVEIKEEITTDDFSIRSLETQEVSPKYDMTLYTADDGETMDLTVVYKGNIYDEYSITSVLDNLLEVIPIVLADREVTIARLTYEGEEEDDDFNEELEEYYDR